MATQGNLVKNEKNIDTVAHIHRQFSWLIELRTNGDAKTAQKQILKIIGATSKTASLQSPLKIIAKRINHLSQKDSIQQFWQSQTKNLLQTLIYDPHTVLGIQPHKFFKNQTILYVSKRYLQNVQFKQFIQELRLQNFHFQIYQIYQTITSSSNYIIMYMTHLEHYSLIQYYTNFPHKIKHTIIHEQLIDDEKQFDEYFEPQYDKYRKQYHGWWCNYNKIKQEIQRRFACFVPNYNHPFYQIKLLDDSSVMIYNDSSIYIESNPP